MNNNSVYWDRSDGLVGKSPSLQAWGLAFESPTPTEELGMDACARNPGIAWQTQEFQRAHWFASIVGILNF